MRMTWYLLALVLAVLLMAGVARGLAPVTQAGIVMDYGDFDLDQWVYDGSRVSVGRSDRFDESKLIQGSLFASVRQATTGYPRISTFGWWGGRFANLKVTLWESNE